MPPVSSLPQVMAPQLPFIRQPKTTMSQHSGSHPSVLECAVLGSVDTPSTVTLRHSVGCSCQNIELRTRTPWISTRSQLYGSTNDERSEWPEPGTMRSDTGRPSATQASRNDRSLPLFQDEVLAASSVPLPVTEMSCWPSA